MRCISPKRRTTSAQSAAPSEPTKAQRPINVLRDRGEVGHVQTALARRRCLVPADAVYEWKVVEGGKQPYAIARQDGQPMAFGQTCNLL